VVRIKPDLIFLTVRQLTVTSTRARTMLKAVPASAPGGRVMAAMKLPARWEGELNNTAGLWRRVALMVLSEMPSITYTEAKRPSHTFRTVIGLHFR